MTIARGGRVLIVDGSAEVRSIVRKLLAKLGFRNVEEAPDSATALTQLAEKQTALLILSWNLEPMDGRAVLKKLRAEPAHANLPVIVMTSEHVINKVVQAVKAGATCIINTPFDADTLKAKIEQIGTK
jgi:two-component system, chemotaxis family, chemotaxis protein CheY